MNVKIMERDVLSPLADTEFNKIVLNPIPDRIGSISLLDNTKSGANIVLETIRGILGYSKVFKAR